MYKFQKTDYAKRFSFAGIREKVESYFFDRILHTVHIQVRYIHLQLESILFQMKIKNKENTKINYDENK